MHVITHSNNYAGPFVNTLVFDGIKNVYKFYYGYKLRILLIVMRVLRANRGLFKEQSYGNLWIFRPVLLYLKKKKTFSTCPIVFPEMIKTDYGLRNALV